MPVASAFVVVEPDGTVRCFGDDPILVDADTVTRRRASHVLPPPGAPRWLFQLLRHVCGESGRTAAWTRSWRGPWSVDLAPSGGPVLGPFLSRDEAIAAERWWLVTQEVR